MKPIRLVLLVLMLCFQMYGQQSRMPDTEFARSVYPSVYDLYSMNAMSTMDFTCSAWAFEQRPPQGKLNVYRFATSSHCITLVADNKNLAHPVRQPMDYYVADSDADRIVYTKATLVAFGDRMKGDDFAVLEVKTPDVIKVAPLGHTPTDVFDEPLLNIGNPLGHGRLVLKGYVSRLSVKVHPLMNDGNTVSDDWYGFMIVQLFGSDTGDSGSPVFCLKQQAVCGFLSGGSASLKGSESQMMVAPVDRFKAWYKGLGTQGDDLDSRVKRLEDRVQGLQNPPPSTPARPAQGKFRSSAHLK